MQTTPYSLRLHLLFWWEVFGELLFPTICVHCQHAGQWLCSSCIEQLDFIHSPLPLSPTTALSSLQAALEYSPSAHDLLHALKYPGSPLLASRCAQFILQAVALPPVTVVSWVPAHPLKLQQRGFNQSESIAQEVARVLHIPARSLLLKTKHTKPLARSASKKERHATCADTFAPTFALGLNPPKSVLLVDDVTTTGATLETCAQVLRAFGVEEVHAVAVAHGQ